MRKILTRWRAKRRESSLVAIARTQFERLQPDAPADARMLHGEGLLITGVLAAIAYVVASARRKMDELVLAHTRAYASIAALGVQVAELPGRLHIVMRAGDAKPVQIESVEDGGKQSRRTGFLTRIRVRKTHGLDIFGDAISTADAIAEHAALTDTINREAEQGGSRHHHHVSRFWRLAAQAVLFFDVLALLTLTLKLQNVSTDPLVWQEQTFDQAQRLGTAVAFALFAAVVLGVSANLVGSATYRYIHRESSHTNPKTSLRMLIAGWSVLALLSAITGATIYVRLFHEAGATDSGGSVGTWVSVLIGLCGFLAPVAVAFVDAMDVSPEVQRRTALARIIHGANHDGQALARAIERDRQQLTELEISAERLIAETGCQVDTERLAAHQAILRLRAQYGYAGEQVTAIVYPCSGDGFLADYDHAVQMKPLHDALAAMRSRPKVQADTEIGMPSAVTPLTSTAGWSSHDAEEDATPAA